MISPELATFLRDGLGVHIATRNARFEPSGARALAVRVHEDAQHLTVYLAAVAAERLVGDLGANGQAAVGLARPADDRACQLKGTLVSLRQAEDDERDFVVSQWTKFLDNLEYIGIPRAPLANWSTWPVSAITIKVTAVFEQTPGPDAGKPFS